GRGGSPGRRERFQSNLRSIHARPSRRTASPSILASAASFPPAVGVVIRPAPFAALFDQEAAVLYSTCMSKRNGRGGTTTKRRTRGGWTPAGTAAARPAGPGA